MEVGEDGISSSQLVVGARHHGSDGPDPIDKSTRIAPGSNREMIGLPMKLLQVLITPPNHSRP